MNDITENGGGLCPFTEKTYKLKKTNKKTKNQPASTFSELWNLVKTNKTNIQGKS